MSNVIWYALTTIAAGAWIGGVVCGFVCIFNMIRLIQLQRVFSDFFKNPLRMFSIYEAIQGDAFTDVGKKPRTRAMWAIVSFVACWFLGVIALAIRG